MNIGDKTLEIRPGAYRIIKRAVDQYGSDAVALAFKDIEMGKEYYEIDLLETEAKEALNAVRTYTPDPTNPHGKQNKQRAIRSLHKFLEDRPEYNDPTKNNS